MNFKKKSCIIDKKIEILATKLIANCVTLKLYEVVKSRHGFILNLTVFGSE